MKILLPIFILVAFSVTRISGQPVQDTSFSPPLFVFNNGVKDEKYNTPGKQVTLLKSLGYAGMEKNGLNAFDSTQQELDKQGLKMFTIYVNVNLDPGQPHFDSRLPGVLQKLKGRETMLWLNITSKGGAYPPSSSAGDTTAIRLVRKIADMAERSGIKIMLYPHIWFWLENFELGLGLVEKIDRENVGITFNLPHFLAQAEPGEEVQIPNLLKKADKKLFAVSICGATVPQDKNRSTLWNSLIQPLGWGTFDNRIILKTLKEMTFTGPVGLQCYNIKGDKYEILESSMKGWKEIIKKL